MLVDVNINNKAKTSAHMAGAGILRYLGCYILNISTLKNRTRESIQHTDYTDLFTLII